MQIQIEQENLINMAKVYRCPKCNNSDIVWDVGLKRYVCPKDKTPLIDFIPTDEVIVID
jgi:hypothetical protein